LFTTHFHSHFRNYIQQKFPSFTVNFTTFNNTIMTTRITSSSTMATHPNLSDVGAGSEPEQVLALVDLNWRIELCDDRMRTKSDEAWASERRDLIAERDERYPLMTCSQDCSSRPIIDHSILADDPDLPRTGSGSAPQNSGAVSGTL
jgi:hypothetical protein